MFYAFKAFGAGLTKIPQNQGRLSIHPHLSPAPVSNTRHLITVMALGHDANGGANENGTDNNGHGVL